MKEIKNKAKYLILLYLVVVQITGIAGCSEKEYVDDDYEETVISDSGCDYDIGDCYYDPLHYLGFDEPDIFEKSKGKYENDYFSIEVPENYYCVEVKIGYFIQNKPNLSTMYLEVSYYDNCLNKERLKDIEELYDHIVDVEYANNAEDDYDYAKDIGLSVTVSSINGYDCVISTYKSPSDIIIYSKRVDFLDLKHNKIITFEMRDSSTTGKKHRKYFDEILASFEIK